MLSFRVRGIDATIRNLAHMRDDIMPVAQAGMNEAAEYLAGKVRAKFGNYQPTGGGTSFSGNDGDILGGPWAQLKEDTIKRKLRLYGIGNRPLVASGQSRDAIKAIKADSNSTNRIVAYVGTDSDEVARKLINAVYGAPRGGVPRRDPLKVTAYEERDNVQHMVESRIRTYLAANRGGAL